MQKDIRQRIIYAAIKRLVYFGVAKTTLEDIANDLSLSKASLYYHFVNKNDLIGAAFEYIFAEYFKLLYAVPINQPLGKKLDDILSVQWQFFMHYNLFGTPAGFFLNPKNKKLQEKLSGVKLKHLAFFYEVFQTSKNKNEIEDAFDIKVLVDLYFQCLLGLTMNSILDRAMSKSDEQQYQIVHQKARAFTSIFVKGIAAR